MSRLKDYINTNSQKILYENTQQTMEKKNRYDKTENKHRFGRNIQTRTEIKEEKKFVFQTMESDRMRQRFKDRISLNQ